MSDDNVYVHTSLKKIQCVKLRIYKTSEFGGCDFFGMRFIINTLSKCKKFLFCIGHQWKFKGYL